MSRYVCYARGAEQSKRLGLRMQVFLIVRVMAIGAIFCSPKVAGVSKDKKKGRRARAAGKIKPPPSVTH